MSNHCVGVPATYIIRPGRSLGKLSLYTMGGTLHPRLNMSIATHQLAHSVSLTG